MTIQYRRSKSLKREKVLNNNFFNIGSGLELNIGTALHVIAIASKNRNNKRVLTPEKLAVFVFLVEHPVFLNRILCQYDREEIFLEETEFINIKDINPAIENVLEFSKTYALLREMCMRGLITLQKVSDSICVDLTADGEKTLRELTSWHSQRVGIFSKHLRYLANTDGKKLVSDVVRNV